MTKPRRNKRLSGEVDRLRAALAAISCMSPNYGEAQGFEDHSSLVRRMREVARNAIHTTT